jgi:hypothetical protein
MTATIGFLIHILHGAASAITRPHVDDRLHECKGARARTQCTKTAAVTERLGPVIDISQRLYEEFPQRTLDHRPTAVGASPLDHIIVIAHPGQMLDIRWLSSAERRAAARNG